MQPQPQPSARSGPVKLRKVEITPDATTIAGERISGARAQSGKDNLITSKPTRTLAEVSESHANEYQKAVKKPRPDVKLPPGAKQPSGEGPLGQQKLRAEAKKQGLPDPDLPEMKGPFPHEVGASPEIEAAMARTAGRITDQRNILEKGLSALSTGVKKFFVPSYRLNGRDAIGPEGQSKTEYFNPAKEYIRQLKTARRNMREVAVSDLEHILGPTKHMTDSDYSLFLWKLSVDEMAEAAGRGDSYSLPGVPREQALALAQAEQVRLEPFVKRNKVVQDAYRRHLELNRAMGDELAARTLIKPHQRQFYLHHQIMDYLKQSYAGRGPGERIPNISRFLEGKPKVAAPGLREYRPSQTFERSKTNVRDIARDYLRVHYEYLATTREALLWWDNLQEIARRYDIREKPMKGYEAASKQDYSQSYEAPPGYERYNMRTGFAGMRGNGAVERIFGEILDGMGKDLSKALGGQGADNIVDALLPRERGVAPVKETVLPDGRVVPVYEEAILPKDLVDTLREAVSERQTLMPGVVASTTRFMKNLILHKFPFQYNLRNAAGDMQAAYAQYGNEMFNKQLWKESWKDVYEAYKNRNYSDFMRWAQENNVTSSGRTAVEVENIGSVETFQHLFRGLDEAKSVKDHAKALLGIFKALPRAASAREDLMRVYLAKMNLARAREGKPMLSGIVDIRGLDPSQAAAKVARESLGDYGNFTKYENSLRDGLMPFYSWASINLSRWPKIVGAAARGAVNPGDVAAVATTKGFTAAIGITIAARIWNDLIMGDAERALPEHVQETNHIILPDPKDPTKPWIVKDDDGRQRIQTITVPDALDDFLDWTGMGGAAPELKHLFAGRMSLQEYLLRRKEDALLKDGLPFPGTWREALNLLGPIPQSLTNLVGYQLFPDPLNPRKLKPGERVGAMAGAFGLSGFPGVGEDLPGTHIGVGGPPSKRVLLDAPQEFGYRADIAGAEDAFVKEARIEVDKAANELQDYMRLIGRTQAGVSSQNLDPEERRRRVDKMKRTSYILQEELRRRVERLNDIRRTAQRITVER